jgi:hypothetical protein
VSLSGSVLAYFPVRLRDEGDPATLALAARLDAYVAEWKAELLRESMWRDPVKAPSELLTEFAYMMAAGAQGSDSESLKRALIEGAVRRHKLHGLWDELKARCDAVTGASAVLWGIVDPDDWILCGDGVVEGSPNSLNWAALGTDGVELDYGIWLVGAGDEAVVSGNVYVDLGTSTATPEQILAIRGAVEFDVVPAYFIVTLGYSSGVTFVPYPNGVI